MKMLVGLGLAAGCAAHSNLIFPKPRNAIDSLLPEWSGGKAPYVWQPFGDYPCACSNGTEACESAQTCLWFSDGCSIGCKECDGGYSKHANPSSIDRCGSGMKATVNDPKYRTINRNAPAGSDADWTKHNPWRAPGNAPVYDACGRASGGPHIGSSPGGLFTNTTYAHVGQMGSTLPKFPTGVVWKRGDVVDAWWSLRANHGGGYQYRLCPADSPLTEACFQKTPMPFAGNSEILLANGTRIEVASTFVSEGTLPKGSTWQRNPIPGYTIHKKGSDDGWRYCSGAERGTEACRWFEPPCEDAYALNPQRLGQGLCSGEWFRNITTYDHLRVPTDIPAGEYVLGFRWDAESTAQVWASCADITIA